MHEVIPGILEQDWTEIERKIELVKPFVRTIHIDLLDGIFAPNTTFFDPTPFKKYSQDILFELHMMVEEPEQYLEDWSKAGFRRFLGHVEMMSDQVSFVSRAEELGEVGLAIDGKTDFSSFKVDLEDLDTVLVMTINAGFSGQQFEEEKLSKVRNLRQKTTLPIELDGGITDHTLQLGVVAGANRFVSTSFIFKAENPEQQYDKLQKLSTG